MGVCHGLSGAGEQRGRAAAGRGGGLPAPAGVKVQPFGNTRDRRAPAVGGLQNGFGRSRGTACQNVLS